MNKFSLFVVLGLTLAAVSDGAAGHRHGGYGGGCYGGGYGGYYGGGYGGYYGGGYYGGYYGARGMYSGYGYAPSTYYSPYGYAYTPANTYGYPYTPSDTYSYPTGSSNGNRMGSMVIRVPAENTEIWVDGTKTTQRGLTRNFQFQYPPSLQNASYQIKARWQGDNGAVVQTRTVRFQPSQPVNVDFRVADLAAEEEQEPNAKSHTGTFVSATGADFVMETNGKQHTHPLADNARVYDANGTQCKITDLQNGQRIRVTTKEGDNKTATKVEVLKKKI
jgi:hypothetical protein